MELGRDNSRKMKRIGSHSAVPADSVLDEDAIVEPQAVFRKLNNHLIPWLFTLGVLCYLDRTNLSFAALELNRDLGLSCSTYGLGAALFFVSYALFQMPSTVVCARLGAPIWLSINIVAWGLVACAMAAVNSVPAFLALRVLLGATESAAFPGMWYHLSLFYPESTTEPGTIGLGAAYARVASCTALAQVLGAPLAAGILMMDGVGGLRGWQWLFLLEGAATVVFGAALKLALAPSPAKARMLTHPERAWLQQRQARAAAARQQASGGAGGASSGTGRSEGGMAGMLQALKRPLAVIRDWRILWLSACWLLVAATMFAMTFFMPLLVSAMFSHAGGLSSGTAAGHHSGCSGGGGEASSEPTAADKRHSVLVALATAIPFMTAALGMNINARLAERANERHRHAGAPILLAGAMLALTPLALSWVGPGLAFTLLSLAAGLCWSFHGPFFSWPAVFLSGEQAAAGFAFINSMGAVGGFIGPFLLGRLSDRADGGFTAAMAMLACFCAASGSLILTFPAPGHRNNSSGAADGERDKVRASDDGSSAAIILRGGAQNGSAELLKEEEEEEGDEEAGGSRRANGRHEWGAGGAAVAGEEEASLWRQQRERERLRGVVGSGGSSSRMGPESELEFQPILPPRGSGRSA